MISKEDTALQGETYETVLETVNERKRSTTLILSEKEIVGRALRRTSVSRQEKPLQKYTLKDAIMFYLR